MESRLLWTVQTIGREIFQVLPGLQGNVDQSPQPQHQENRLDPWRRPRTFYLDFTAWLQMGPHLQRTQWHPLRTLCQKPLQLFDENNEKAVQTGRHQPTELKDPQIPKTQTLKAVWERRKAELFGRFHGQQRLKIEIQRRIQELIEPQLVIIWSNQRRNKDRGGRKDRRRVKMSFWKHLRWTLKHRNHQQQQAELWTLSRNPQGKLWWT